MINELVTEQQKVDAQCAHNKSEIEELKRDIANSNKQKPLFSKALAKKVIFHIILNYHSPASLLLVVACEILAANCF
jgi:hypothetical protein